MIFSRVEPNTHYRELRLASVGGNWELGLSLYASGMRVRMGRGGRPPSVLDFCMGTDERMYGAIFAAVLRRLQDAPEESSPAEIDARFPWAGTRPDLARHLEQLLAPEEAPAAHGAHESSVPHGHLAAHSH